MRLSKRQIQMIRGARAKRGLSIAETAKEYEISYNTLLWMETEGSVPEKEVYLLVSTLGETNDFVDEFYAPENMWAD